MAVKIADRSNLSWSSELESLKLLYHVNIVKLYDTFEDDCFRYLVLEHCSEGTLKDKIANGGLLCIREFRDIAVQLLDALIYCHAAGIAHLDIKPENIFFHSDGRVRLGDFGCSRGVDADFMGGSLRYMPPEIMSKLEHFDKFKADIWSLGVTFYGLVSGKSPWNGSKADEIRADIRLGSVMPLAGVDPKIPPVIMGMLQLDPGRRTPLKKLLNIISEWPGSAAGKGKAPSLLRQLAGVSHGARTTLMGSRSMTSKAMLLGQQNRRSSISLLRLDETRNPFAPPDDEPRSQMPPLDDVPGSPIAPPDDVAFGSAGE
jgi:serine/threonine protein kinase